MAIKIYHNPRCSKSRQALAIIKSKTSKFEVIDYLKNPLTFKEIKLLLSQLNIKPLELIRIQESIWKENYKGKMLKDDLVKLAQELNLKFRRGRFWMKAEDASKDHLIKKITIEDGGNRSLDKPRDALTITFKEAVELFQKPPNRRTS